MSKPPSLNTLVRGAQSGYARDLDLLLAQLRPMVLRWAVIWTGSPDAAEDIAQKVLMSINDSLDAYTPEAKFTTWAYRITRNALLEHDRAHGRQHALRDRFRLREVATTVAVDQGIRALEAVDLLRHLVTVLSPQQRAALDLVELQGFTAREAAEMMEVAPATVRVHLHRAREALRTAPGHEDSVEAQHG